MQQTCNSITIRSDLPLVHGRSACWRRPRLWSRPALRASLLRQFSGALLAATCMPMAMATDTVQLRVTGRIVPAPCTIALGNNSNADFGKITAADLPVNGMRKLTGQRAVSFSIKCVPANSPVLSFKDERHDTVPAIWEQPSTIGGRAKTFGLGRVANKNIGMYTLHFSGIQADGASAKLLRSADGESGWNFSGATEVISREFKYVWSTTTQSQSASFRDLNGELVVKLWPEPLSELPLQGEIKLDGSATLVLEYP